MIYLIQEFRGISLKQKVVTLFFKNFLIHQIVLKVKFK